MMNKELMDKLQFQAAAQVSPLLEGREWQRVYLEKYTQMVVEETMKEVDERTSPRGETSWFDSDKDWVRLHFGYGKLKQ